MDEVGGSWKSWATFIINETKRFGSEMKDMDSEIKNTSKELHHLQTDLIKMDYSRDLVNIQEDIKKISSSIEELQQFKIKILAITSTINIIFGISITIIGLFR